MWAIHEPEKRDGVEYLDGYKKRDGERRVLAMKHGEPLAVSQEWDFIRRGLLSMAEEDLRVRSELATDGSLFGSYHPAMRALHDANATRLASILESVGWPVERQVGSEAAEAAWLIVQHAIAHPALQRRALELVQAAAQRGDAPALHAAMLEDRIRTLEGLPQRYGTQFDWDAHSQLSPLPVEDPANVDVRRRQIGLGPLKDAVRDQRARAAAEREQPPVDWHARRQEMETWCREVGWRG
jgi:hypothetical protein